MRGPLARASSLFSDISAPGAPSINKFTQIDNGVVEVLFLLPITDANEGPLTGLKKLTAGVSETEFAEATGDFDANASDNRVSVELTDEDIANGFVKARLPILSLDQTLYFAAFCED